MDAVPKKSVSADRDAHRLRNDLAPSLALEYLKVDELRLDPKHPHEHNKRQLRQIQRSIGRFGFCVPIIVDAANQVVCGVGRVLAAKAEGILVVPAIRLEHLSAAEAKALMLADNRLSQNAHWNPQLLGELFMELSAADLDFELEITGFATAEIDAAIAALASPLDDERADALPPRGPAVSRVGDLWHLGEHRVLCADATLGDPYGALMGKARAAMVFSDPPFNVAIAGHVTRQAHHGEFVMASGEMSEAEFTAFLLTVIRHFAQWSADGSLHFLCMDWRHLPEILAAGREAYGELKNLAVWVKRNAGMGSFYRSRHELVLVFKNGSAPHHNNIELGKFGRSRTNVWEYDGANIFGRTGEEGNLLALHPTVKPVALVADAILDASRRGDIVLDGFLGSGTTVIAAEKTGRRCFGLELDPGYLDLTVRRWQAYTGAAARHAETGLTFDETLEQRSKRDG
jgi:DNA modification methylase